MVSSTLLSLALCILTAVNKMEIQVSHWLLKFFHCIKSVMISGLISQTAIICLRSNQCVLLIHEKYMKTYSMCVVFELQRFADFTYIL